MMPKKFWTYLGLCALAILFPAAAISAGWNSNAGNRIETGQDASTQQAKSSAASTSAQAATAPAERDGSHDFDFEVGTWTIHLKRRLHPLTGSNTWVEFDGTSKTFKIWDGRAQLDTFESDGSTGHIEGLTLRTYDPTAHEWRLSWANSKIGILDLAQVGKFKDGRGEFYCQDLIGGRTILIRFIWSGITANSAHFEQSFSDDGGKTWEVNWITDQTRVSEEAFNVATRRFVTVATSSAPVDSTERDGQHDFDPIFGSWKYELKRRIHPMTGSNTWVDLSGTGVCYKIWDGRAQLDTFESDGSTGHIEGLTLRLYNPASHEWRLYWANSRIGILDPPQVGKFTDGHGDFYTQDTINGKTLLIRYDWTKLTTSAPHFEQSFSDDGGKTWEVNWITDQTCAGDAVKNGN